MITDLIIEDGRCLGAVGLHLPTGEYRVYRAKVTLSATGGCTQFYGWNSTSATTNNVLDNTADVEMAPSCAMAAKSPTPSSAATT